jgi:hypothetical protein
MRDAELGRLAREIRLLIAPGLKVLGMARSENFQLRIKSLKMLLFSLRQLRVVQAEGH